jgi:hypothetical protein
MEFLPKYNSVIGLSLYEHTKQVLTAVASPAFTTLSNISSSVTRMVVEREREREKIKPKQSIFKEMAGQARHDDNTPSERHAELDSASLNIKDYSATTQGIGTTPYSIVPKTLGFVTNMTGFATKTTVFVPNTTGFVPKTLGFVTNMTGFVPKTTGIVPKMTGFVPKTVGITSKSIIYQSIKPKY